MSGKKFACPLMFAIQRITLGNGRILLLVEHVGARDSQPGSQGYIQLGNDWQIEKIISAWNDYNAYGFGVRIDQENGTIEWQGRTGCPGCGCHEGMTFISVVVSKRYSCDDGVVAKDLDENQFSCATIQEAVDMAGEGWRIEVGSGTYDESVFVKKKTGLTIVSQCEAVINGSFKLSQNTDVTIDGFIIDAAGANNHGIILKGGKSNTNTTIQNCEIYNAGKSYSGIAVALRNPNTFIKNNNIHDNGRNGIMFINASGGPHFITGNTIEANGWNGVMVPREHEVTLTGNTIIGNGKNPQSNKGGYGVKRGGVPGTGWPQGITLIDNIIKCNMGTIIEGKSSSDLGNYHQMLDAGDSGNCTTTGDEGEGTEQCGEGC